VAKLCFRAHRTSLQHSDSFLDVKKWAHKNVDKEKKEGNRKQGKDEWENLP